MIATLGGRFGGYGLFLSHSFNWWFRSTLFKVVVWALFVLGLLLPCCSAERSRWKTWPGYSLCYSPRSGGCRIFSPASFESARAGRSSFTTCWTWSVSGGKVLSLSAGKHTIVFDFKYDGPGPGKGGTGVLSVDGKEVAARRLSTRFRC